MPAISIIPQPVRLNETGGTFTLTPNTAIVAAGEASVAARQFCDWIAPATGFALTVQADPAGEAVPSIEFRLDAEMAHLGAEGYSLAVTPRQIVLRAVQLAGLFYAMQTLRQLLPPEVLGQARVLGIEWVIPCVEIEDRPRFAWRGSLLDVCRHFMPKAFILKYLDLLALHKLNVFHWHLTDDQGWRIEIKKYPRLTEVGGWRKETLAGHYRANIESPRYDGQPHGGFYTQDDVREVVAYARDRHITIVPEIEMPGHAQAAIAAYPELGNTGKPLAVGTRWGIIEDVYNVEEHTIRFLQDVLDEVMTLFPSPFIHIGGDEVPKTQWQASPAAQARMKELGLKNEEELQSYFIHRMDQFLVSRGRRLIGWDEILEGGLAPNATVMSWRGEKGGIAAAMSGHDVVMAPYQYTYLDYYQALGDQEPLAIGGYLPLEKVYGYEPLGEGIDAGHVHHVLGAQAQIWTEYIPDPAHVEYMAFPRLCALSELVWTPAASKDYANFLARLQTHARRLSVLKVNYRPL